MDENENWKWVVGCRGFYRVSRFGEVRSVNRRVKNGWVGSRRIQGKVLKSAPNQFGHLIVHLWMNGHRKHKLVHHLVLEAFVGPCPEGMECRHLDGNPANNHLGNLCWGTREENMQDRIRHGAAARGEKSGTAKLTDKEVKKIRRLYEKENYTQKELSAMFGTTQSNISRILWRKLWTHV